MRPVRACLGLLWLYLSACDSFLTTVPFLSKKRTSFPVHASKTRTWILGATPRLARRPQPWVCSAVQDPTEIWRELRVPEAGCVLVADETEVDHFFRHAVVLVLDMGDKGSRGLVLEMATAFNLGEMTPSVRCSTSLLCPCSRSHLFGIHISLQKEMRGINYCNQLPIVGTRARAMAQCAV
jgi:hypothetical protein